MCHIRRFYWLRELYEADFHKLGIYGSGQVLANAWDLFRLASSRGGPGRRAAVDFVVCLGGADFLVIPLFFDFCFLIERTRPATSMRSSCLINLSASNEVRPRKRSDRVRYSPIGKEAVSC